MPNTHPDFTVDEPEDSPGFLLWQVTTLWQRGIRKELEAIGITHPQFVLLASLLWLSREKDSVMQIDLSQHSKIDPMTTSTVIRTLQRKKLVERKEHATDTRAKVVTLTAEGARITRKAVKIIERFDTGFFHSLDNQLGGFTSALQVLRNSEIS